MKLILDNIIILTIYSFAFIQLFIWKRASENPSRLAESALRKSATGAKSTVALTFFALNASKIGLRYFSGLSRLKTLVLFARRDLLD